MFLLDAGLEVRQKLCTEILATSDRIVLREDGADPTCPKQNIEHGKVGANARCSKTDGKSVTALSEPMLNALLDLARSWKFRVTDIAGGGHSPNSRHYLGSAVDIDLINDEAVLNGKQTDGFLQACRAAGATEIRPPRVGSPTIHVAWPTPVPRKRKALRIWRRSYSLFQAGLLTVGGIIATCEAERHVSQESQTQAQQAYRDLDDGFKHVIDLCLEHAGEVDCLSASAPAANAVVPVIPATPEPTPENVPTQDATATLLAKKSDQQAAVDTLVVDLFENAFQWFCEMPEQDGLQEMRQRQWQGWINYMKKWIARKHFTANWDRIKNEYDTEFKEYLDAVISAVPGKCGNLDRKPWWRVWAADSSQAAGQRPAG